MGSVPDSYRERHRVDVEANGDGITVDGLRVPVYGGAPRICVGCHTITRQAWERLKCLIDREMKAGA